MRRRRGHDRHAVRGGHRGAGSGLALEHAGSARPPCPGASACASTSRGPLEQILHGPAHDATGVVNLTGALRRAMALCGFETLKELQKAELVVVGDR